MNKINHPRPQLRRENWRSLEGKWNFIFDNEDVGRKQNWEQNAPWKQTIKVPFTYETVLSGIGDSSEHKVVWYEKQIGFEPMKERERKILHFEGVDYRAEVWVNGRFAGNHTGPYSRFSFDITDLLSDDGSQNRITVRVEDSSDMEQPRGKQRWMKDNYSCWYVQTTGIWKSVWLETVGYSYLKHLKITPDVDAREVNLEYEIAGFDNELTLEANISYQGTPVNSCSSRLLHPCYKQSLSVEDESIPFKMHLWFPKGFNYFEAVGPELYDLEIVLKKENEILERTQSYFGMRKISIENGQVLINNYPFYQKLILDQGYWPDSSLTPPDEEALIRDLQIITDAGYNGVRKHQKTEDERFLYHCDHEGILVWGEIGSTYRFNDRAQTEFTEQWNEVIRQFYNHPSIITWVPFNESWGIHEVARNKEQQNFVNGIYSLTKGVDPMRPVITNDGWEHTVSDILTIHDYEESGDLLSKRFEEMNVYLEKEMNAANGLKRVFAQGYTYKGQPVIISEFGGIAFNSENGWGYGNMVSSEEEFLKRFDDIHTAIQNIPYINGYCYTQVSDVEQEVNGIVRADRTEKLALDKLKKVNDKRSS